MRLTAANGWRAHQPRPPPRSARRLAGCVAATSSRSAPARGPRRRRPTDRIQSRISIVPATVARQRSEPSASVVDRLGRVPGRLADAGRDRRREAQHDLDRVLVGDDVPGRPSADVVAAGSGGSNVRGVSATSRIRSILNVRIAPRVSSKPIRYSAWVWSDGSSRYGRTVARPRRRRPARSGPARSRASRPAAPPRPGSAAGRGR